jgi:hypothetical protein
MNKLGHLLLSAATCAILTSVAQFGIWFIGFIIMTRVIGKALLVGMNYLAWPIVFPLLSLLVVFPVMLIIIPLFRQPFPDILSHPAFLFGMLIPTIIISIAIMFATCPLENGGTLLTTGWDAFG